jgi:SAM-dependent methyltransferase
VAGARAAELPSAGFITADAQTWPFQPASFDAAISRFGVMFFEDPTAAFRNIRRAVRPSGKLAFAAWRSPAENPFMTAAAPAAAALLPELQAASDPDAPGQFAFAREDRTRRILADAGWTGIELAPLDVPAAMPERDLPDFVARVGPLGTALQALDAPERPRVIEAVLPAFDRFVRDGVVAFDMACWMVTAKA